MTWANYAEVIDQMTAAGLVVSSLEPGRLMRCCTIDDHREKRGWYNVSEAVIEGVSLLVGSFGVWHGNDNGVQKISLKGRKLTREQQAALKVKYAEDRRRAKAARAATAARAAKRAAAVWKKCLIAGDSEYLRKKGVGAHGLRYTESGASVLPMTDTHGTVQGLQFILPDGHPRKKKTGRGKEYWPPGLSKHGHYHLIGGTPKPICLLAEGYATAATLHEATGLAVAVAFDAGNMPAVATMLKKRYPNIKLLACADDDYIQKCAACGEMTTVEKPECVHCAEPHQKGNAGIAAASAAAVAVDGSWLAPKFAEDRGNKKLTDFNDLQLRESVAAVRTQIETHITELGWSMGSAVPRGEQQRGAGEVRSLRVITSVEEMRERFVLIYGHKSTAFDRQERKLIALSDVRDLCAHRDIYKNWYESADKTVVRLLEVGFDPTETDQNIKCNLWGGWPTVSRSGSCERLLELLEYLCMEEEHPRDIYQWVLRWLAYPIKHPGAKMKTALVLHGPQGVGKNLFFESVMAIYGEYGRIVDQNAVEDKFNDWASKKLFLIADEVVARAELYHTKNKLKIFITSPWIRINPKNITAYEERNHINVVFLSNETHPVVLERDDRRYVVIWTPPKLPPDIYKEVKEEIDAGGIEALHDYLLNLEMGDFGPHTPPPKTKSKDALIDLSMDSTERFLRDWESGDIPVPFVPCISGEVYDLYRYFSGRSGYPRYATDKRLWAELEKRGGFKKPGTRYDAGENIKQRTFVFPPKVEQPTDKNQTDWLADCVNKFREAFKEWKDGDTQTKD